MWTDQALLELLSIDIPIIQSPMAGAAGVRADICIIAVPSRIRSVRDPHQASGVSASEP